MHKLFIPEWNFPIPIEIPQPLREEIGGSEPFLQLLVRRGFTEPQKVKAFLDANAYTPCSGMEMPGMEKAALRIQKAIQTGERIGVWGDFDVDGQTSTAVLVSGLRKLDSDVIYRVPVRGRESHGITIPYLQTFLDSGIKLLITCDTGISANEAVEYANQRGVDVIITDHHTLPENLPNALALINPQFLPEGHPLGTLSGVGVAYELIESLFSEYHRAADAEELLDLVALGLIADLAILTLDARYLVQKGLQRMRASTRQCLSTILKENKISPQEVTEDIVSYVIAPRLNAVGRLDDANPIVEFLLSDDPVFAAATYNRIEGLNSKRKILCDQVFKGAQAYLEQEPKLLEKPLIYLSHPEWPSGVVGIVASRLVELYHRPAILFNTADPESAKGSARSIAGVNITEAIQHHHNLLNTFGGHPMAAGLSVPMHNFDALKFELFQTITEMVNASNYRPSVNIDMQVDLKTLDMELVNQFQQFAPFGPGNPPILFSSSDLEIASISPMGRSKEHERINVSDTSGNQYPVIWWQAAGLPHPSSRFDLAFSASLANFKGKSELRLEWQEYRESTVDLAANTSVLQSKIESIDCRHAFDPDHELLEIAQKSDVCVYSEGKINCPVEKSMRQEVHSAKYLAFWTIPPSLKILHQINEEVKPKTIFWFANLPMEASLEEILKRVGTTLKRLSENKERQQLEISNVAAECATTDAIIRLAVNWFDARGDVTIQGQDYENISFSLDSHPRDAQKAAKYWEQIVQLNNEIAAFRNYYKSVESVSSLLPVSSNKTNRV